MRRVPLYPEGLVQKALGGSPAAPQYTSKCTRCSAFSACETVCMPPISTAKVPGVTENVLVVIDNPSALDDTTGALVAGVQGRFLEAAMQAAGMPVYTVASALACHVAELKSVDQDQVNTCRVYLANTLNSQKFTKIICLGSIAGMAVLGRKYSPLSCRRGYAYTSHNGIDIPVHLGMPLGDVLHNSILRAAFIRDIAHMAKAPPKPDVNAYYNEIITEDDAEYARLDLSTPRIKDLDAPQPPDNLVFFDVETHGKMYTPHFRIESIALFREGADYGYLWSRDALEDPKLVRQLSHILRNPNVRKGGHNVKYDVLAIRNEPLLGEINRIEVDTRLIRKLVETDTDGSLDACGELVGLGGHKQEAAEVVKEIRNHLSKLALSRKPTPSGKKRAIPVCRYVPNHEVEDYVLDAIDAGEDPSAFAYRWIPKDILHRYNARDVYTTSKLYDAYIGRLNDVDSGPATIWEEVTKPAMWALTEMEHHGIPVDVTALKAFETYLQGKVTIADLECKKRFGPDFNAASPKQVGGVLVKLGADALIPPRSRTATGQLPTDDDMLTSLSDRYPDLKLILEFRRFNKLLGTYATGLLSEIRNDGCIHASFLADGAESGRVSCQAPNLQTWPRANNKDEPEGKMLRDCLYAPPGMDLGEVDYSQAELRGAAYLASDRVMIDIFKSGVDFHLKTAQQISQVAFKKNPEDITDADRSVAKTTNFALLFELREKTAFLLAKRLKIDKTKAGKIVEAIFGQFTSLSSWMDERIQESRRTGLVRTEWNGKPGRVRPLWHIGSTKDSESYLRESAERSSYNSMVQGTCADWMNGSLWKIHCFLKKIGGKLILTIHDSVLILAPEDVMDDAIRGVIKILCRYKIGDVPLVADAKVGKRWGSLEKWKG